MKRPSVKSRVAARRDPTARGKRERGAALIAALLVVTLVTMLGAVALQESINAGHQGASTAKNLQTVSAGRAGVDSVLAGIQSVKAQAVLNGGTANPPCPSINTANSTGGAVNAASRETYSLWYEVMLAEPDGPDLSQFGDAVQQLLDENPSATTWPTGANAPSLPSDWRQAPSYCGPAGSMQGLSPGNTYYVAVAAGGNTSSTANGWVGKPSVALLELQPYTAPSTTTSSSSSTTTSTSTTTTSTTTTTTVPTTTTTAAGTTTTTTAPTTSTTTTTTVPTTTTTTASSGSYATFSEGVFAGDELTMSGNFQLYEVSGGPSIPPGIPTYTPGYLDCQNTGDYYNGDVWAGATGNVSVKKAGADGTSGSCVVAGNLYIIPEPGPTAAYPGGGDASAEAGSTVFSASTTVNGNVYLAGTGDLSSSGNVTMGNILTNGSVTLTSGTVKVNGSIYAVGNVNVTLNGGSYITGNVYSETGTVTITMSGGTFTGSKHAGTVWPTSPSPCAGSYVTCDPSGKGLVTPFPSNPFPSLTASNFSGYSVWVDPNDTKTYPSGCSSNVNSSVASTENSSRYSSAYANYRPAVGDATYAVYHEIETATTPTVVETPCAIEWDDSATNGAITINSNVAVLAQGGFTTGGDWANPGVLGQYSSSTYQLYMVVPYSGSGAYPVNGEPIADLSSCPESTSQPPNVYQYATGNYSTGDIWLKGGSPAFGVNVAGSNPTTQNVKVFFYTPDNMCTAANPEMTGQVYVGGYLATGSGWTMTVDPDLVPPSQTAPTTTTTVVTGTTTTTSPTTTVPSTTTSSPTTTVASTTSSSSTTTVPSTTSSSTTGTSTPSTTTSTTALTGGYWTLSVISLG